MIPGDCSVVGGGEAAPVLVTGTVGSLAICCGAADGLPALSEVDCAKVGVSSIGCWTRWSAARGGLHDMVASPLVGEAVSGTGTGQGRGCARAPGELSIG